MKHLSILIVGLALVTSVIAEKSTYEKHNSKGIDSGQISPVILTFINDFKAHLKSRNPSDPKLLQTDTEHMQALRNLLDDNKAWD